jgi:hypothetical protein
MNIELEMTDDQFADMQMVFADIVWCLEANSELQKRAIRLCICRLPGSKRGAIVAGDVPNVHRPESPDLAPINPTR